MGVSDFFGAANGCWLGCVNIIFDERLRQIKTKPDEKNC